MSQYLYAISVVAVKDHAVNNQLFNGLADKNSILQVARDLVWQFDPAYKEHIMMITCNLSEQCNGGMIHQFGLRYNQQSLQLCAYELFEKLQELLN